MFVKSVVFNSYETNSINIKRFSLTKKNDNVATYI